MQSTWENLVDYDMSESGVRPLTLRELVDDGVRPRGVPRRAARLQPVERHDRAARADRRALPGRRRRPHRGHQRHVRSELPDRAQPAAARRRRRDGGAQLHADAGRGAQPRRRRADVPPAARTQAGSRTGTSSSARSRRETRLLYLSNPNNPTGSVLSDAAMRRIVDRCEQTGTWLLADEVYLGAEIDRPRTKSFWGMSDRVIVTSGLSKAYGIPGVRIGWIVGPPAAGRRVLDAARLHHHRPEQDVGPHRARRRRAGEPRALLRAHAARSCGTTCRSRASGSPASAAA